MDTNERSHALSWRRLVAAAPVGVEVFDTNGIITYGNHAFHRLFGYPDGALIGRSFLDLANDPGDRERRRKRLAALYAHTPQPTIYRRGIRRPDGSLGAAWVAWDYLRDSDGRVTGMVTWFTEIPVAWTPREGDHEEDRKNA